MEYVYTFNEIISGRIKIEAAKEPDREQIIELIHEGHADYHNTEYTDFCLIETNGEIQVDSNNGSKPFENFFMVESERQFDPNRQIAIIWRVDDVLAIRPDLSNKQAMEVLRQTERRHDATMGISWDTLAIWADELFPKK